MQTVVVRVREFVGPAVVAMIAVVAMVALHAGHGATGAATDPWDPRPAVRVTDFHGSIPETVEEVTASARRQLGRVFGLR